MKNIKKPSVIRHTLLPSIG